MLRFGYEAVVALAQRRRPGEFVPVPGDTHITNLCFGGPDLTKAYVTQSYAGRLVEIDWPRPGLRLFEKK